MFVQGNSCLKPAGLASLFSRVHSPCYCHWRVLRLPVTSLTIAFGPAMPKTVREPGAISVLPAHICLQFLIHDRSQSQFESMHSSPIGLLAEEGGVSEAVRRHRQCSPASSTRKVGSSRDSAFVSKVCKSGPSLLSTTVFSPSSCRHLVSLPHHQYLLLQSRSLPCHQYVKQAHDMPGPGRQAGVIINLAGHTSQEASQGTPLMYMFLYRPTAAWAHCAAILPLLIFRVELTTRTACRGMSCWDRCTR